MIRRMLRAFAAAGLLLGLWAVAPVQAHATSRQARCQDVTVPVSIAAGQPAGYRIWGQLCTPPPTGWPPRSRYCCTG
jgi:hypothetical protein